MKLALQQATTHVLQDFMNVHTHAQVVASMTAEIAYTAEMTAISTATSVALMAFGGWAIKGISGHFSKAGAAASKAQTLTQMIPNLGKRLVKGVVSEVFEEIAIDSLVEQFAENFAMSQGWSADAGFWLSSVLTSLRETSGSVRPQTGGTRTGGLNTWIAQDQALQGLSSQQINAELFSLYQTAQQLDQRQDAEQTSAFKELMSSNAFKILGLAVPSFFFGGFALIGAIKTAAAFGSKIINAPKTISQYRTAVHAIKQGIKQAAPIKKLAKSANLDPRIVQEMMRELTNNKMPLTSIIPQGSSNPRIGVDISVDDYVNSKLETITPAMAYAPITSTTTFTPTQSFMNLEAKLESINRKYEIIRDLDSIKQTMSDIENTMQESRSGEKLSADVSGVVEKYDPRFNALLWDAKLGKVTQEQMRLDIYADHSWKQAIAWLKRPGQLGIPAHKRIGILVHGMLIKEGLKFKGIDKKEYTIERDTKLSQILEWMGYKLSEEIYLVEIDVNGKISKDSGYRATVAQEIAASKWRYWTDKGQSQISTSENHISEEFPNIAKFQKLWEYLYKGKLNFDQMMFSYEDIKAFDDLYDYVESLSTLFLEKNLDVFQKGKFDPQKLEDEFKIGYFYNTKFMSKDKLNKLPKGFLGDYIAAVDQVYDVIFASGFKNFRTNNLEKITSDQAMFTILDIIMRKVVLIQVEPQFGGSGLYGAAPKIREFLESPGIAGDLVKDMLSGWGRYSFFEKFSESFFDSEQSEISLTRSYNGLKGRELEAQDCLNDFATLLVDIVGKSKGKPKFEAFINGMNFGKVFTYTLSKLGLNSYIEEHGSLESNEERMFKQTIDIIRNTLTVSDRSFVDAGGFLVTDTTFYFREAKNSADLNAMTYGAKRGIANDLIRDVFMGVQVEFTKFKSGTSNILLKDLRNIDLTATVASKNGPADLTAIINNIAKRSRFRDFYSGSSLKFPAMYTHLYSCADQLNVILSRLPKSRRTIGDAFTELHTYITSGNFDSDIRVLAGLAYTDTHFAELTDGHFEAIKDYFLKNLKDFIIPSSTGSGFTVSLKERVSLLFKNLDSNGDPIKLKVSDLPTDIELFENGNWIKLSEKFKDEIKKNGDHTLDAAYIVVHDKTTKKNGLLRVDSVMNTLPNGIEEGYFDALTGKVYNNIFVSDTQGNYIFSRIELSTFDNDRSTSWYSKFTNTNGELQKEAYIVFGFTASNQYTCFLFDTLININPKEIFQEYLPGIKRTPESKSLDKEYEYILTDPESIVNIGRLFDLNIQTVSSVVYQFDRGYLMPAGTSRKGKTIIGPTRVLLSEPFFNLYPHEFYYYSFRQYSNMFKALGITGDHLKQVVPISISGETSTGTLLLSPNGQYSPKRFYKVFQQALAANVESLKDNGLIDEKTYNRIQNLRGFSLSYELNLDDQAAEIVTRDKQEILLLNAILIDIFGYSGYTILKSGLMAIEKTAQGYEFFPFALEKPELLHILQSTYVVPFGSSASTMKIGDGYFKKADQIRYFFIDLLTNGHAQSFKIGGRIEKVKTNPDSPLGAALYPLVKRTSLRSREFLSRQYNDFLNDFSKGTSSNLIILGKNTILQGIYEMLDSAISDVLIMQEFALVIDDICDSDSTITTSRAIEIVRELVLSHYYTYYSDNIFVSAPGHDYMLQIFQMLLYGKSSAIFESRGYASISHPFFKDFKFVFDFSHFTDRQIVDIVAASAFFYGTTFSDSVNNPRFKSGWSLSLDSVRNEIKDSTIKTFNFLLDIFDNYDPNVNEFSIYFHRPGISGIHHQATLHSRIDAKYRPDNGELGGTFIDVDRNDPQSVIDAIASIILYMQKYNAFVTVKEGFRNRGSNTVVVCFDQRKIYRPDIIQGILASKPISAKHLSAYSESRYESWANQYDEIVNLNNILPLYLFHDVNDNNKLAQIIVDYLRIYLGVQSQVIKLQK